MTPRLFPAALFLVWTLGFSSSLQAEEWLIVPHGTRIRGQLETTLSSRSHRQGDRFTVEVAESILVNGVEAIPAGSVIEGRVSRVKQAGRVQGRAEMNLSYDRLVFPSGMAETIIGSQADLDHQDRIDRSEGTIKGASSRKRDAAAIGISAASGAGIGLAYGGGGGAVMGAGIGGLIGLVDRMARRGEPIRIPAGTLMIIRLDRPLQIRISGDPSH